jgi:hypothetical protein
MFANFFLLFIDFLVTWCSYIGSSSWMMSNVPESGIYPDLLHIMDLQLCHDVISSCLLDMSDTSSPRERKLQQLLADYDVCCSEQRHMAHTLETRKLLVSRFCCVELLALDPMRGHAYITPPYF